MVGTGRDTRDCPESLLVVRISRDTPQQLANPRRVHHRVGARRGGNGKLNGLDRMFLRVQCYAGRKGDERPVRFQLGDREYLVEEILDQWYGPDEAFYKVRADDRNLYILRHNGATDEWTLESFRRLG
jgi:hypothetical protein